MSPSIGIIDYSQYMEQKVFQTTNQEVSVGSYPDTREVPTHCHLTGTITLSGVGTSIQLCNMDTVNIHKLHWGMFPHKSNID